jgi:hypothetical protein
MTDSYQALKEKAVQRTKTKVECMGNFSTQAAKNHRIDPYNWDYVQFMQHSEASFGELNVAPSHPFPFISGPVPGPKMTWYAYTDCTFINEGCKKQPIQPHY